VTIGTPPQPVAVQLDTGSTELWVNPTCASSQLPDYCNDLPRYVPGSSTSSNDTAYDFQVTYGSGDVTGKYHLDTMAAGPAVIASNYFGLATTSHIIPMGILGIGPFIYQYTGYYPFIFQLAHQGSIARAAYSLDLRAISDPAGSLTLGGMDTKKYSVILHRHLLCLILRPQTKYIAFGSTLRLWQ
jgi:hypothetical protein